ncbi:hypothetical protein cand_025050 [Cryptosporidium andersoni]|uniref:ABC transporter domain-containing protein n=1 Tax=Cryptosporidium andersoni TaxID=117008 RepID=A0A1J4MAT7_9CRYT|nr:hypothetical protein cand_025050 [Cryptosporidium andersoni]
MGNLLSKLLLLEVGSVASNLLKSASAEKASLGNTRAKNLPNISNEVNIEDDSHILSKRFELYDQINMNDGKSYIWTAGSVYKALVVTFGRIYGFYLLLLLISVFMGSYVKYYGKEFFSDFIKNDSLIFCLKDAMQGFILLILQVTNVIFTSHCEYFGAWLHVRLQGAITGSALSRLANCRRIKNIDGSADISSFNSTIALSRYQNLIVVDAEFAEYMVSNSINLIVYPFHILASAYVAHSVFGGKPLVLCLIALFTCFGLSVASQCISSIFKKPFMEAREERVAEVARLLDHSKYIAVTHQLFPVLIKLLKGPRAKELLYNSYRKYICTFGEIFDRLMSLSCAIVLGFYVWYNALPSNEASFLIVQSVWLIPSFYQPLNMVIYFVYYIIEGYNGLERIANFLNCTAKDYTEERTQCIHIHSKNSIYTEFQIPGSEFRICSDNHKVENANIIRLMMEFVSYSISKFGHPSICNISLELKPSHPVFILGPICSGKSAILQGLMGYLFSVKNKGRSGKVMLVTKEKEIQVTNNLSNYLNIGYVPQQPWVPSGCSLAECIICGKEYRADLWNAVVYECDLWADFHSWGISGFQDACSRIFTDRQLSAGQKVRLSLARAIYCNLSTSSRPSIVLFDSVFSALDPVVCKRVFERLYGYGGLLSSSMSLIVVEPPVLEIMKSVASQNGFDYSVLKCQKGKVTSYESFKTNYTLNENTDLETTQSNNKLTITSCEKAEAKIQNNNLDILVSKNNESNILKSSADSTNNSGIYLRSDTEFETTLKLDMERKITTDINDALDVSYSRIELPDDNFSTKYSTNMFYLLFACSKKTTISFTDNDGKSKVECHVSHIGTIVFLLLLLIPPIICKAAEYFLLSVLHSGINFDTSESIYEIIHKSNSRFIFWLPNTLGCKVLPFWYSIYNIVYIITSISVVVVGILEISLGLRAAKYIHDSLLLGYLGAPSTSMLRWLPTSFILNRLSTDQLTIDYCITRRIRFVVISLNTIAISLVPSIYSSDYPLFIVCMVMFIGWFCYIGYARYFVKSCQSLRSCYVSELSPLVETVQTIGKGGLCITSQNIQKYFIQRSWGQLQAVLRPLYLQAVLDAWFRMRMKLLMCTPIIIINIFLTLFFRRNLDSKTRTLLAISIAAPLSTIPEISSLVNFWTKLETELVSVERCRAYIAAARKSTLEMIQNNQSIFNINTQRNTPLSCTLDTEITSVSDVASTMSIAKSTIISSNSRNLSTCVILDKVIARHSRLDSCDDCNVDRPGLSGSTIIHTVCLNKISAAVNPGEIVGVVGRTGCGKTSLLGVLSHILPFSGTLYTPHKPCSTISDAMKSYLKNSDLCLKDIDSLVLEPILEFQASSQYIAFLPLEVYVSHDGILKDIVDPFDEFDNEDIFSALSICGFGPYISDFIERISNTDSEEISPLLKFDYITHLLNTPLSYFRFGSPQIRMLLFVHYFLKKQDIKMLLVDEPPVIEVKDLDNSKSTSCILSRIITHYFKHCVTFIVAHDARSLKGITRIWALKNGELTNDDNNQDYQVNLQLDHIVQAFSDY